MRGWSNVLSLWRLCGNAACQRARCCRGEGAACFNANYLRLPEGARAWFEGLGKAQQQKWSFDQAVLWLDGLGLTEEFTGWCAEARGEGDAHV